MLWPQETNLGNDLGLLFPELLELCYMMGQRSLGAGQEKGGREVVASGDPEPVTGRP